MSELEGRLYGRGDSGRDNVTIYRILREKMIDLHSARGKARGTERGPVWKILGHRAPSHAPHHRPWFARVASVMAKPQSFGNIFTEFVCVWVLTITCRHCGARSASVGSLRTDATVANMNFELHNAPCQLTHLKGVVKKFCGRRVDANDA